MSTNQPTRTVRRRAILDLLDALAQLARRDHRGRERGDGLMALRPGQRVRLRDADAEFEMRLRSVPASYCPACYIRLPLSGEPNCDCEPANGAGTAKTGPRTADGAERAHVDPPAPDSAPEPTEESA